MKSPISLVLYLVAGLLFACVIHSCENTSKADQPAELELQKAEREIRRLKSTVKLYRKTIDRQREEIERLKAQKDGPASSEPPAMEAITNEEHPQILSEFAKPLKIGTTARVKKGKVIKVLGPKEALIDIEISKITPEQRKILMVSHIRNAKIKAEREARRSRAGGMPVMPAPATPAPGGYNRNKPYFETEEFRLVGIDTSTMKLGKDFIINKPLTIIGKDVPIDENGYRKPGWNISEEVFVAQPYDEPVMNSYLQTFPEKPEEEPALEPVEISNANWRTVEKLGGGLVKISCKADVAIKTNRPGTCFVKWIFLDKKGFSIHESMESIKLKKSDSHIVTKTDMISDKAQRQIADVKISKTIIFDDGEVE